MYILGTFSLFQLFSFCLHRVNESEKMCLFTLSLRVFVQFRKVVTPPFVFKLNIYHINIDCHIDKLQALTILYDLLLMRQRKLG